MEGALQGIGPFPSCEEAIAPAFSSLMRRAMLAGWTEEEIRAAIVALANPPSGAPDNNDTIFGRDGTRTSTGCIRGRGTSTVSDPGELDIADWTEEDHETARFLEDVFSPEAIRSILAKRRQKQTVTIRLDLELVEALKAEGDDWHARINEMLRAAMKVSAAGV